MWVPGALLGCKAWIAVRQSVSLPCRASSVGGDALVRGILGHLELWHRAEVIEYRLRTTRSGPEIGYNF
jgi:hypothetical protein